MQPAETINPIIFNIHNYIQQKTTIIIIIIITAYGLGMQIQCGVNFVILDSKRFLVPSTKALGLKHISNLKLASKPFLNRADKLSQGVIDVPTKYSQHTTHNTQHTPHNTHHTTHRAHDTQGARHTSTYNTGRTERTGRTGCTTQVM